MKNNILVSHECPIDMLKASKGFNDYEYGLLHLMHIPEYKEFYKNTKRDYYLDNSAYEYQFIEGGFDIDHFYDVINETRPSHVIIPDVIADMDATIENALNFDVSKMPDGTKLIGVVQGKTFEELEQCYDTLSGFCDLMAIVFHSPAYQLMFPELSKDEANAKGRPAFIKHLLTKSKVPVNSLHLIGLSLPSELLEYSEYDKLFIKSIDSANPIQFGMLGQRYNIDNIKEIKNKPAYVMTEEAITKTTNGVEALNCFDNIVEFRQLLV